jgi:hypothetical protein
MVGLLNPTSQESENDGSGNQLSNLLAPIRPHRLNRLARSIGDLQHIVRTLKPKGVYKGGPAATAAAGRFAPDRG